MTTDAPIVPSPVGAVTKPRPMLVTDAVAKFGRTLDEILGMMDDGAIGAAVPVRLVADGPWFDDASWQTLGILPDGKRAPTIPFNTIRPGLVSDFMRVTIDRRLRFADLAGPPVRERVYPLMPTIHTVPQFVDRPRTLDLEAGRPIGLPEPVTLADGRIVKFVWCRPAEAVTLSELYIPFADLPTLAKIEPLPLVSLADAPSHGVDVAAMLDRAQRGQARLVCLPARLRDHAKGGAVLRSRVAWVRDFVTKAGHSTQMRPEPRGVGALAACLADGDDFRSLVAPGARLTAKRFEAVMAPGALMPHDDVHGIATSVWAVAVPLVDLTIADLWIGAADLEAVRSTVTAPTTPGHPTPKPKPAGPDWADEAVERARAMYREDPAGCGAEHGPSTNKLAQLLTLDEPPDGLAPIRRKANTVRNLLDRRRNEIS